MSQCLNLFLLCYFCDSFNLILYVIFAIALVLFFDLFFGVDKFSEFIDSNFMSPFFCVCNPHKNRCCLELKLVLPTKIGDEPNLSAALLGEDFLKKENCRIFILLIFLNFLI